MNQDHHRSKATAMLKHVDAVLRNKRILLGYHDTRLAVIRELRWRGRALAKDVEQKLSPLEKEVGFRVVHYEYICRVRLLLPSTGPARGGGVLEADGATWSVPLPPLQFFKSYDRLLNQYMRSGTGIGLDITADPVRCPHSTALQSPRLLFC